VSLLPRISSQPRQPGRSNRGCQRGIEEFAIFARFVAAANKSGLLAAASMFPVVLSRRSRLPLRQTDCEPGHPLSRNFLTLPRSPAPSADSPQCAKQPWTAASNHKAYDVGVHDFGTLRKRVRSSPGAVPVAQSLAAARQC